MAGKLNFVILWPVLFSLLLMTQSGDAASDSTTVIQDKRHLRAELSVATDESDQDRTMRSWKTVSSLFSKTKADKLFTKHGVGKTTSNLFETNAFGAWFVAVQMAYAKNPAKAKVDMISALTKRYGDEALAKMLATTEDDRIIREMKAIQLNNWDLDKRSVEDIYKLLKLDKDSDKLLENPLMATWVAYATKLDNENPYGAVFSTLSTRYEGKAFAIMLQNGKEFDDSVEIADKLEVFLMNTWQREKKSVVDIYKLLNLDKDGDQFFQNPLFETLSRYATFVNQKDSFSGVFSLLQSRYDDEKLADLLVTMKNWWPRNVLTKQLEDLLLKTWQSQGKTLDDVFKLLKLEKERELLYSKSFLTWVSFAVEVEKDPYRMIFSTLKRIYGEKTLTTLIVHAFDKPATLTLAEKLENILIHDWVKAKITVRDAFVRLKLNAEGENVFESMALSTWVSYTKEIERGNADKALVAVLREQFGDAELPRIIAKAHTQFSWNPEDEVTVLLEQLQKLLPKE
ncbi:hypothetical protein P3T76_009863 [Phytophthora citrophthora]|uniref:RxLR effector protein n=1 Tax=Phytophthora citrophthora TaxID=4793 RepID=A0AAD9LHY1_9STRA|nr:hypothetical protein P3T76_009863 [Phytophthora citrophthora]